MEQSKANQAVPHQEHRWGAHLPYVGHWASRWIDHYTESVTHGQCDARPTVTFSASGHHHPLTGTKLYCLVNRGKCVRTTCPRLLPDSAPTRELILGPFGHHCCILILDRVVKKRHKVNDTTILHPYVIESCGFQQNVPKEILYVTKISI